MNLCIDILILELGNSNDGSFDCLSRPSPLVSLAVLSECLAEQLLVVGRLGLAPQPLQRVHVVAHHVLRNITTYYMLINNYNTMTGDRSTGRSKMQDHRTYVSEVFLIKMKNQ